MFSSFNLFTLFSFSWNSVVHRFVVWTMLSKPEFILANRLFLRWMRRKLSGVSLPSSLSSYLAKDLLTLITTTLQFRLQRILPDADVFNAIYFVFIDAFCFWSVAKCDIFLAWWSNKGLQKKENETTANLILRYK